MVRRTDFRGSLAVEFGGYSVKNTEKVLTKKGAWEEEGDGEGEAKSVGWRVGKWSALGLLWCVIVVTSVILTGE